MPTVWRKASQSALEGKPEMFIMQAIKLDLKSGEALLPLGRIAVVEALLRNARR